jgi:hypothetical protein
MEIIIIVAPVVIIAAVFMRIVLIPHLSMERRATELLSQHPGAEQTSVYLELHSTWAWNKQREIDAKITEMQPQGWTFLRALEASPLRTICSWGGGLTLHFIRTHDSESRHAA